MTHIPELPSVQLAACTVCGGDHLDTRCITYSIALALNLPADAASGTICDAIASLRLAADNKMEAVMERLAEAQDQRNRIEQRALRLRDELEGVRRDLEVSRAEVERLRDERNEAETKLAQATGSLPHTRIPLAATAPVPEGIRRYLDAHDDFPDDDEIDGGKTDVDSDERVSLRFGDLRALVAALPGKRLVRPDMYPTSPYALVNVLVGIDPDDAVTVTMASSELGVSQCRIRVQDLRDLVEDARTPADILVPSSVAMNENYMIMVLDGEPHEAGSLGDALGIVRMMIESGEQPGDIKILREVPFEAVYEGSFMKPGPGEWSVRAIVDIENTQAPGISTQGSGETHKVQGSTNSKQTSIAPETRALLAAISDDCFQAETFDRGFACIDEGVWRDFGRTWDTWNRAGRPDFNSPELTECAAAFERAGEARRNADRVMSAVSRLDSPQYVEANDSIPVFGSKAPPSSVTRTAAASRQPGDPYVVPTPFPADETPEEMAADAWHDEWWQRIRGEWNERTAGNVLNAIEARFQLEKSRRQ